MYSREQKIKALVILSGIICDISFEITKALCLKTKPDENKLNGVFNKIPNIIAIIELSKILGCDTYRIISQKENSSSFNGNSSLIRMKILCNEIDSLCLKCKNFKPQCEELLDLVRAGYAYYGQINNASEFIITFEDDDINKIKAELKQIIVG